MPDPELFLRFAFYAAIVIGIAAGLLWSLERLEKGIEQIARERKRKQTGMPAGNRRVARGADDFLRTLETIRYYLEHRNDTPTDARGRWRVH